VAATTEERSRPSTPLPTDPERFQTRRLKRDRAIRRVIIAILALFVVAGLFGIFGYRTGEVTASGGGYDLSLSYPLVGRPGVPIQWILHIHRDAGLPAKVTLATSIGYLDVLDMNDIEPQPDSTTTTQGRVYWTFSSPGGTDMTITMDAFISTNAHRGSAAVTSVIESGRPAATLSYRTLVSP
jgi:hypothetical protein